MDASPSQKKRGRKPKVKGGDVGKEGLIKGKLNLYVVSTESKSSVPNTVETKEIIKEPVEIVENAAQTYFLELHEFTCGYPETTNILCWWCCHAFDTHPIGAPVKYNQDSNIFTVVGCFCSFACAYAFMQRDDYFKKHFPRIGTVLLEIMYKTVTKDETFNLYKSTETECFQAAPDRMVLKSFGGKLSIEEFRNLSPNGIGMKTLLAPLMPWSMYYELATNNYKNFNRKPLEPRKAKFVDKKLHEEKQSFVAREEQYIASSSSGL